MIELLSNCRALLYDIVATVRSLTNLEQKECVHYSYEYSDCTEYDTDITYLHHIW